MKIYNNLSICALAGLLAFTSCTKEESLGNGSTAQTFQISVSDMGFQGISDGRAIDENFKTTFVKGDAIGMYGVENGQLVDGISNRKFTLNEKGVWDLDGNPIEYDSERFKNITFYAYYPYQENVAFDPAAEDPFLVVYRMLTQILAAKGNDLISTANGSRSDFYWSSNERNDSFMWVHNMDGGTSFVNRRDNGTKGYFRMMLAF